MFEHLNPRTREIVSKLVARSVVTVDSSSIGPLDADRRLALYVIASNLEEIKEIRGSELGDRIPKLIADTELPESIDDPNDGLVEQSNPSWKISEIRTCSYRGLAPAGKTWTHNFNSESHLLYGPNGCGKSSLLGAIAWCLTARVFRDDGPPSLPVDVDTYTADAKPKKASGRPDALTLLDHEGNSTSEDAEFWVELCLRGEGEEKEVHERWVRRHSSDGLSSSEDGSSWNPITNLGEVGVSELDAELHLVMPARVPHLHFGESPDLVRLFSEIIGLDDLEAISAVADRSSRALKSAATKIEKGELGAQEHRIESAIAAINDNSTDHVRSLSTYQPAIEASRTLETVAAFGNDVKAQLGQWRKQLLNDIGIDLPSKGDPEFTEVQSQVDELSGRVQLAVEQLERPIDECFPTTVDPRLPEESQIQEMVKELDEFEQRARKTIEDRLKWAKEEQEDSKAKLMLVAAQHFDNSECECPVCTQGLERVPDIKVRLEELRPLSAQPQLEKLVADLERELLADLDQVVGADQRLEVERSLSDRLVADWENLKENRFAGLLRAIADRYDGDFAILRDEIRAETTPDVPAMEGVYADEFPSAFGSLTDQISRARQFCALAASFHEHSAGIRDSLRELLLSASDPERESLLVVLRRGADANKQVQSLESVYSSAKVLWESKKKHSELDDQIRRCRNIADWMVDLKGLGQVVRRETTRLIEEVQPEMKRLFEEMYENEILTFDMLTSGHAANPDIKNQVNVYLLAGNERIPMGPFSNAGRARALLLAFVFALLERSEGSVGVLVLDDPALSLDDDHHARFVDKLVGPCLESKQVILATHYGSFFKNAQSVFARKRIHQLPPRRTIQDPLAFEPGDLLKRLEVTMQEPTCSWRECSVNLRRWAERTLRSLSGFCPEPFYLFNKIQATVDSYDRIVDPRIATGKRDEIVSGLRRPEVARVIHRAAHDEDPSESEIRDALSILKDCEKTAVIPEIERLKSLYNHATLGRAVEARANVSVLSFDDRLPPKDLEVKARAAAASGGVGVDWIERDSVELRDYAAVRVTTDVLAPVALAGQIVLLDPDDSPPSDSDLVAVEIEDGHKFVRRFWRHDEVPYLENVNPNTPSPPILVSGGECRVRRIVGVLFDEQSLPPEASVLGEWTQVGRACRQLLVGVFGIRVHGTSLEPIARDGQIVLAHQDDVVDTLANGELACVDAEGLDAVIKRCKPGDEQWVLTAVNSTMVEDPIVIATGSIRNVYRLAGVMFETRE